MSSFSAVFLFMLPMFLNEVALKSDNPASQSNLGEELKAGDDVSKPCWYLLLQLCIAEMDEPAVLVLSMTPLKQHPGVNLKALI